MRAGLATVILAVCVLSIQSHLNSALLPPTVTQQSARDEADATVHASELLVNQSKYAEAREQASLALGLYEQLRDERGIGRAQHVLGLVATMMGDMADARIHFEVAITAFEKAGHLRGRGKATLGLLRVWSPDAMLAAQLLERTVSDARVAGDYDLEGRAEHAWGDRLFWVGDYDAALQKLDQAVSLFTVTGDALALGTVHNSRGRLYRRHGRADLALNEQLIALSLHERFPTAFEHLQSLNAVAVTYQALGDLPLARTYLDRALILAEQMASPQILGFIQGSLAMILAEQGDAAQAARLLERVLAAGLESQPSPRYAALSGAYLALGRHDDALGAAERAVELCPAGSANDCLVALPARAQVHAAARNRTAALDDLRAAIARLEDLRKRLVPADFLKQQFAVAQEGLFSRAISFQFEEGQTAEALDTAERTRARAFLDLLAANEIEVADTAPAEDALTTSPIEPPFVLRGGGQTPSATRATTAAHDLLPSPGSADAAESREFRALAARLQSTLLMYWVADDGLFIWVVRDGEEIHSARVPVRAAKLRELVRATLPFAGQPPPSTPSRREQRLVTRGQMAITSADTHAAAWRQLYELLIRPVRPVLPHQTGTLLTIVPHGPLSGLSFAALTNERGRYLLEDFALHYVPAAGVLRFTAAKRQPDARTGRAMLVADPTLPPRGRLDQPLPELPGARAEVRAISSLIGRNRAAVLEGRAATESTVRLDARQMSVLHFATHAIVRDDDPFGSFLALRPSSGEAAEDGYLTAREIYGLQLRADLVVLSACRSGGGHVTGDGIATFARAFLYAGSPTVITSLWDVADQPTNRLLPDFYRSWMGGQSKSRALRSAALRLMRDLRAGRVEVVTPAGVVKVPEHPVFWAGFALVGEPE